MCLGSRTLNAYDDNDVSLCGMLKKYMMINNDLKINELIQYYLQHELLNSKYCVHQFEPNYTSYIHNIFFFFFQMLLDPIRQTFIPHPYTFNYFIIHSRLFFKLSVSLYIFQFTIATIWLDTNWSLGIKGRWKPSVLFWIVLQHYIMH